jgi:hypothetical protein
MGKDVTQQEGWFDWAIALVSAILFIAVISINGFPFLLTDTIRYAGIQPGLSDSPILLNQVMRPFFSAAGLWGPAILGIVATSYTLGRLASISELRSVRWFFPVLSVASLQYLYAGMVSTEIWFFVALGLIVTWVLSPKVVWTDLALISIGSVAHSTLLPISAGALVLMLAFFFQGWRRILLALGALVVGTSAEWIVHKVVLGDEPPMRYTYLAGEILSNQIEVYEQFCIESPRETLCREPYNSFISKQRSDPKHSARIDRKFTPSRTQLFVWGPTSFWGFDSMLPSKHRLTRAENEAAGAKLWSYSVQNHAITLFQALPAKALAFWSVKAPGVFVSFDTWYADTRIKPYSDQIDYALTGFEHSLQARGILNNWHYRKMTTFVMHTMIIMGLIAPIFLIFLAEQSIWRLSIVFAGFFVGNFFTVSLTGSIIGRYLERAVFFCGLNALILFAAIFIALRTRGFRRI